MSHAANLNVVTGAFGYIGRYITQELLTRGQRVRTITTHPDKPNPFGSQVTAFHYDFDDPAALVDHLRGARCLFNTYYIRFERGSATFERAVANTRLLFDSARHAGVEKIIHIGVTNAQPDDELPYYRGKAHQDRALRQVGLDYTILRPTLVFGVEDILVNNIAWLIRRFPVFPIFGDGRYRVQPVFVGDLARLAVEYSEQTGSQELDVIGPETFTFESFLRTISGVLAPRTGFFHLSPRVGWALGKPIGWIMNDVMLTWNELRGLMREKLISDQKPNAPIRFSQWLIENQEHLGTSYTSELARHFY